MARPGRTTETCDSGTEKSTLMRLVSSSVVMIVPGFTRLPTLTRRRPTWPSNGARTIVSPRREADAATLASLALRVATIWSSWDCDRALVAMSSTLRSYWLLLSTSAAWAWARSAVACVPSSSTSTSPLRTAWPSLKRMAVMRFEVLAVTSIASLARAVPSASSSYGNSLRTACPTTTEVAGLPAAAVREAPDGSADPPPPRQSVTARPRTTVARPAATIDTIQSFRRRWSSDMMARHLSSWLPGLDARMSPAAQGVYELRVNNYDRVAVLATLFATLRPWLRPVS